MLNLLKSSISYLSILLLVHVKFKAASSFDLIVINIETSKQEKSETPEDYFEKFATKAKTGKSPKKESKAAPKRRKRLESDDEYDVDKDLEEMKELED